MVKSTGSKGERKTRKILKEIFGVKFPKARPNWLFNNRKLELDGYNRKLNIAFEYNGSYHYEHSPFFHKKYSLEQTQQNDKIKQELCEEQNIKLIVVPYNIKFIDMKKYIINQCLKLQVTIPIID